MRQYIGARYVPKFMGAYDATQIYEALSVVDNGLGTSYISKVPTPAGTPLTDTDYWAIYGASSGAIISLQDQIDDMKDPNVSGSLQQQIDTNTTDIQTLADAVDSLLPSNKNYVFVGDSFMQHSDPWQDFVVNILGLSSGDYQTCSDSGLGFSHVGASGNNAAQLVTARTFTDPDKVTDVIAILGTNDTNSTDSATVGSNIASFVNACKAKFSNLQRIFIGYNGTQCGGSYISNAIYKRTTKAAIEAACANNNVTYIPDVAYALLWSPNVSDGLHPNATASEEIARAIVADMNGGEFSAPHSGVSTSGLLYYQCGNKFKIAMNAAQNLYDDNSNPIDVKPSAWTSIATGETYPVVPSVALTYLNNVNVGGGGNFTAATLRLNNNGNIDIAAFIASLTSVTRVTVLPQSEYEFTYYM